MRQLVDGAGGAEVVDVLGVVWVLGGEEVSLGEVLEELRDCRGTGEAAGDEGRKG